MDVPIIIAIGVCAVIAALLIFVTVFFFRMAFYSKPDRDHSDAAMLDMRIKQIPFAEDKFRAGFDWFSRAEKERFSIRSRDGLTLWGEFIPHADSRGIIAMFHGYRSTAHADFSAIAEDFYAMGFSLFLPDQRAHGQSEGRYITFGAKERYDCAEWITELNRRFGAETPIFLDGISMGCTTVLAATGLELPANVRGVIADCGFTSPAREIAHFTKDWLRAPKFPIYYLVALAARVRAGFSLKAFDTEKILEKCNIPVLFVHGTADKLVPVEMTKRNFEACAAPKRLVLVEGADHGESYLIDKDQCGAELIDFLETYG